MAPQGVVVPAVVKLNGTGVNTGCVFTLPEITFGSKLLAKL